MSLVVCVTFEIRTKANLQHVQVKILCPVTLNRVKDQPHTVNSNFVCENILYVPSTQNLKKGRRNMKESETNKTFSESFPFAWWKSKNRPPSGQRKESGLCKKKITHSLSKKNLTEWKTLQTKTRSEKHFRLKTLQSSDLSLECEMEKFLVKNRTRSKQL